MVSNGILRCTQPSLGHKSECLQMDGGKPTQTFPVSPLVDAVAVELLSIFYFSKVYLPLYVVFPMICHLCHL
jgi:hypothetical protein